MLRDPYLNEQVVNTAVPFGTARLRTPPEFREAEQQLLVTKQVVVSGVFFGPLIKKYVVAIVVPVIRNGAIVYTLSIVIPTEQFAAIVQSTQVPENWAISIVDQRNVIVARSEKHSEFTGSKVRNDFLSTASASGMNRGINREGIASQWTYRRSELTGWYTAAGIPESVLAAPFKHSLAIYSTVGSLLLAIAMGLSYQLGDRISRSIGALGIDRKPTREEFRVLFESAPHGVLVVDSDSRIVLANERLEQQFGYTQDELIGCPIQILLPAQLGKNKLVQPDVKPATNLSGRRKDGSEFQIEVSLNPVTTLDGTFAMATVMDISARKQAEERLWAAIVDRDDLRRRLMQAQEDERLRLAHELHDQTGQSLAAVMLGMKSLETIVDERGRVQLHLLQKQLDQMGKVLHHVAWELRPASIDELGMASALANYTAEWSTQYGVSIDFHCANAELDDLTAEVRTTLYRVVQEALTNVAKHARRATTISVVIHRSSAVLLLTVEDDGGGFDTTAALSHGGRSRTLGLSGMRERLTLIGGELEIESLVGSGTTIFARIPLEKERLIA